MPKALRVYPTDEEEPTMIMPYLNFTGDCEAAFRLYQRAFDGGEPMLARYDDAPESAYPDMDKAQKNKIMHGQVMLTETGGVSGADAIWPVEKGSAIHIHVICASADKAQKESFEQHALSASCRHCPGTRLGT